MIFLRSEHRLYERKREFADILGRCWTEAREYNAVLERALELGKKIRRFEGDRPPWPIMQSVGRIWDNFLDTIDDIRLKEKANNKVAEGYVHERDRVKGE